MSDVRVIPACVQMVVGQIVERFRPRKVILFGSYAYGEPDVGSDADLLVVVETDDPLDTAGRISAGVDHPVPLDILVYTPSAFEQYLAEGSVFVTRVVEDGRVLYEASDDRVA